MSFFTLNIVMVCPTTYIYNPSSLFALYSVISPFSSEQEESDYFFFLVTLLIIRT